MKKIYLDTSVISAYNDAREPEKVEQTKEFLKKVAKGVEIFVSSLVKEEVSAIKDVERKKELNTLILKFQSLTITDKVRELAEYYIQNGLIPETHIEDALHLAIATIHEMDILISWNYTHLVKLKTRHLVNALNLVSGYKEIEIILPIEY